MRDLVKDFAKLEKEITAYVKMRPEFYFKSDCYKKLVARCNRLDSSWDMELAGTRRHQRKNESRTQFLGQLAYPLVKEQMLIRRSIFTSNFRSDPIFSLRAIGNTPKENAINMQDLLESNNEQTRFRANTLRPSIDMVSKWGSSVIYTEYLEDQEKGWRTVADPVFGAQRVFGIVKNTKNAVCYPLDIRNYFQDPRVVDNNESGFRGHIERRRLSWLVANYQSNPDNFIKENIEQVIKDVKAKTIFKDRNYTDPQGRSTVHDFDQITVNDIMRGQFQIHIDGNEDDETYYTVWMIGDKIIRFQSNPYDMNLNQYTVLTCEPRYEYWWGNTPAEASIQNENSMNLLLGMSLENAIEQMKRYVFYNKNAINPNLFQAAASNSKIPVDVARDVNLNNVLFQFQPQDSAATSINEAYRRIMENNQRVSTTPDLNRPPASGGASNKTAYAADIMANVGNNMDMDILEQYSYCLAKVGEKQTIILAQHLGNFGPIMIRPTNTQDQRMVEKVNITGNWLVYMETALQRSNSSEIMRYQNIVTWLLNLVNSGLPIQPNFEPLIKHTLKMGKFAQVGEVLSDQEAMVQQPGFVPTQTQPGQELAGAGQEMSEAA